MLIKEDPVLVIIDIQGKLASVMYDKEKLYDNAVRMVKGARALDIPTIWMEQNPEGIGPTIQQISEVLYNATPIPKKCFSCCGSPEFMKELKAADRNQVILIGIETHICVYQTAMALLAQGYGVHIIADAVSSRSESNKKMAIEKMRDAGAQITSVETILFEMLQTAENPKFKDILKIIR